MPSTRGGSGVVTGCAERATPGFLPHRPWLIFGVADTGDGMDSPAATDATPKLLKASELAERWGLHRATVYRLVQRGELPALRIGGSIRIDPAEAQAWLWSTPRDA